MQPISMTIFPYVPPAANARWASAARSSGPTTTVALGWLARTPRPQIESFIRTGRSIAIELGNTQASV